MENWTDDKTFDLIEWGDTIEVGIVPPWLKMDEQPVMCGWDEEPYAVTWVHCISSSGILRIRLPIDHWAYTAIAQGFTPWAGGDQAPGDWEPFSPVLFADGTIETGSYWNWHGSGPQNREGMLIIGYRPRAEAVAEPVGVPAKFKKGDYLVPLPHHQQHGLSDKAYLVDSTGNMIDDDGSPRFPHDNLYRPATPAEIAQYLAEHALEAQYKGDPLPNAETIAAMQEPRGQSFGTVAELMDDLNDAVKLNKVSRQEAGDHNWDIATLIDFGLLADATDIERFEQHHGGLDNNQRDIAEAAIKWARGNS